MDQQISTDTGLGKEYVRHCFNSGISGLIQVFLGKVVRGNHASA